MAFQCAPPETIYVKINPCCTLVREIPADEDIGLSRETIQFNFDNLNSHVCNLETSAAEVWNPTFTIVAEASAKWNSVLSTVQNLSAGWQSAYATVLATSATWLDPITVIYPSPFPANMTSIDVEALITWANASLPISSTTINGCPSYHYVEGQKLWVFAPKYHEAVQYVANACQAPPKFERALIRIYNTTINYGAGIYHAVGWVGIGGQVNSGSGHFTGVATLEQVEVTAGNCSLSGSYISKYIGEIIGVELYVNGSGEWAYNRMLY